jgi:hypothetical protein
MEKEENAEQPADTAAQVGKDADTGTGYPCLDQLANQGIDH